MLSTLNAGKDGVVRYVLVVRTSGGATNITYEGMRCESRELKTLRYRPSGRYMGRGAQERMAPVENQPINRHHAALSRDYFCPDGIADSHCRRRVARP